MIRSLNLFTGTVGTGTIDGRLATGYRRGEVSVVQRAAGTLPLRQPFSCMREICAFHELHRKVVAIGVDAVGQDLDYVGMIGARKSCHLAAEPLDRHRIGGHRRGQHLERHHPPQASLLRTVEDSHSAAANLFVQLEVADGRARADSVDRLNVAGVRRAP